MRLDEIMDDDVSAMRILRKLVGKKRLTNRDKATATGLMAKLKAKRRNPKPGADLQLGSHINDPFAGDTGSGGTVTVGTDSTGANRY